MINIHTQEKLFTLTIKNLMKHVELRQPRSNRLNYKEKIDHNFSPLASVKNISDIENEILRVGAIEMINE